MARTDNLTNFLTDVSTAIKTKKGDNTPIKASEFDTEIANLPSGGGDISEYNAVFDTSLTGKISANITKIKTWNTKGRTNFKEMFSGLSILTEVPMLDTSSGTDFSYMYQTCKKVTSFPVINTSSGTNFTYMYQACTGMTSFPEIDTSNGTNLSYMCSGCSNLKDVPLLDCGKVTSIRNIFANASNITNVEGFKDLGKAYSTSTSANTSNYEISFTASVKVTEQSLINVLNNLYDIATKGCNTQKCTIGSTNLAKLTSEEGQQALANAQAKGWTVS